MALAVDGVVRSLLRDMGPEYSGALCLRHMSALLCPGQSISVRIPVLARGGLLTPIRGMLSVRQLLLIVPWL